MKKKNQIIAIDFDSTVVTNSFPEVGKDIGAEPVLKKLIAAGHRLILFTMRSDDKTATGSSEKYPDIKGGDYLSDAMYWFFERDIYLFAVNQNPEQKVWTGSPKPYANLYIDDNALGCPLKVDKKLSKEPFVDWVKVEKMLIEKGYL
jgi:hypothetical protein